MRKHLIRFGIEHPKTALTLVAVLTVLFGLQFPKIKIDTDPENMLEAAQRDRVVYDEVKKRFGISDMLVLGVTDEKGILRPESLAKLSRIATAVLRIKGVIIEDVAGLYASNNVTFEGGALRVDKLAAGESDTPKNIERLKGHLYDNPFFKEKLISLDGMGAAFYIPIREKAMSYRISREIEAIVSKEIGPGQAYHIAGLPVAEDTFGYEMFKQMGVTAPLAGMAIFLLMWFLFKRLSLVISPMAVAMISVVWAMGALIGSGFTVHIMSSMIPVFLMPIAVLDSVHILSEFYDRYPGLRDRRKALTETLEELFTPMLYTSLTSAVGFGSLALAPIPPVRVFGAFVAFGILAAWILTIVLIPAATMLIPGKFLESDLLKSQGKDTPLDRRLGRLGRWTYERAKPILAASLLVAMAAAWGVSRIVVNDNPVKWFRSGHKIRVADQVMNRLFGGTYMAYLVLDGNRENAVKDPAVLNYLARLQEYLESHEIVGKTSSLADIVKRINYVLHGEDEKFHKVPETEAEAAQYLFLFLSSGDPNDLDNFVDYDYKSANIWIQMKRGENRDMTAVEAFVEEFTRQSPLPEGFSLKWSGLTYINKVWQDLMVKGMLKAVFTGFAVVFVMMAFLFRSFWLGLASMIPLSVAITFSYAMVGFAGKDYDMPIAVCSSLALGLAIDFAIHFIQRYRERYKETGSVEAANRFIFEEGPGRAIWRNALVVTLGFLPLMVSTLTPYVTVGAFFALLMLSSAAATLLILPALLAWKGKSMLGGAS